MKVSMLLTGFEDVLYFSCATHMFWLSLVFRDESYKIYLFWLRFDEELEENGMFWSGIQYQGCLNFFILSCRNFCERELHRVYLGNLQMFLHLYLSSNIHLDLIFF